MVLKNSYTGRKFDILFFLFTGFAHFRDEYYVVLIRVLHIPV